jgi:hypothetical protein
MSGSLTEFRDLLKRHATGHEADHDGKRHRLKTSEFRGPRVTQACNACASDHLKCSEDKPCRRCVTKNIVCQWPGTSVISATTTTTTTTTRSTTATTAEINGGAERDVGQEPHDLHFSALENTSAYRAPENSLVTSVSNFADAGSINTFVPTFSDAFTTILPPAPYSGNWTPRGFPEFGFSTSIDLDELDLSFLDSYNTEIPFDYRETPSSQSIALTDPESQPRATTAIGSTALRNSHWHFRPNSKDHVAAEQHNLSLHPVSDNHGLPETRIILPKRATAEKLTASSRDRVLAMLLEGCRPENLPKAVASFPSVELLDVLLQYCLTSPVSQVDVFLHLPTFNPNKKRPELLAAVIAYGAVLTGDPALTKLGLAIQECVRTGAVSLV